MNLFYNKENVYVVKDINDINEMDKQSLFIHDGYLYSIKGKDDCGAGIYFKDNKEYFVKEYSSDKDKKTFSIDNVKNLSVEEMRGGLNKDNFINEEYVDFVRNNSDVFTIELSDDDDFLKRIVKTAINSKGISLNDYKNKFNKSYELNNMKSALLKDTKMSVTSFNQWCEILDLKYTITVEDNGKKSSSPLKEIITIYN